MKKKKIAGQKTFIKKSLIRLDLGYYWLWAVFRIILTLIPQTGYIHPDEFFQSVEVFAGNVFKVESTVPWEFDPKFPLRSVTLMYILTSIPFSILKILSFVFGRGILTPYVLLVTPRIIMCTISFLSDYFLYKICYLYGQNFRRRMMILASSYVTLTYATRTFSNTIEMVLFNALLYLVAQCMAESEKVNYQDDFLKGEYNNAESAADRVRLWKLRKMLPSHSTNLCLPIAAVCVAGVFNRATFVTYAVPPVFYWLQRGIRRDDTLLHFHVRFILLVIFAAPIALIFILLDSAYYGYITWGEVINADLGWHSFAITPLNFLRYNLVSENVAQHGLHPRWLHLLVNLPILFNLLALASMLVMVNMVYRGSQMYWSMLPRPQSITSMLTLSTVVPVLVLSVIPHQEPRFLAPLLLPLVFLYSHLITRFEEDCPAPALRRRPMQKQLPFFDNFDNRPNIMGRVMTFISTKAVTGSSTKQSEKPTKGYELITLWYTINILFAIFYGFVHQGGVYPLVKTLREKLDAHPRNSACHLFYSHTYMLPQHLLMRDIPPLGGEKSLTVTNLPSDFKEILEELRKRMAKRTTERDTLIYYALPASAFSILEELQSNETAHFFTYKLEQIFSPHFSSEAPRKIPDLLSANDVLKIFQLVLIEILPGHGNISATSDLE